MADKVTLTEELNIYLANSDTTATRTLKISNPVSMDLTLEQVQTALAPALGKTVAIEEYGPQYFFYDDGNQGGYEVPMTQVTGAEIIRTQKTIRNIT